MRLKLIATAFALVSMTALPLVAAGPPEDGAGHYQGPGIVVTSLGADGFPQTISDTGAVVCEDTDDDGTPDHGQGGVCIPFEDLDGDSILVTDDQVPQDEIAFQVCVDLNGDRQCGEGLPGQADSGTNASGECKDLIRFSHDTATGDTYNPLFIDPAFVEDLWRFCDGEANGGFPGYIVMTCAGVHGHGINATASHTHHVTEGTATGVYTGGTPRGDYCGAPAPTAQKAYTIR